MAGRAIEIGTPADFPLGEFRIMDIAGHSIGVIRLADGAIHAIRNHCPHKGAPVCRGIVGGTWPPSAPGELAYTQPGEVLICPWHGYEYDIRTGRELFREVPTVLRKFPVAVENGRVLVTV
jgi:nitrite reductase (NADH) small subunit